MPSSLIFVGLVVLWLLILVPTVARRQQEVARLSPALLGGRVLERPMRHRIPEVGVMERSGPTTVGELVESRDGLPGDRRDHDRYDDDRSRPAFDPEYGDVADDEFDDEFDTEIDDDGRVHRRVDDRDGSGRAGADPYDLDDDIDDLDALDDEPEDDRDEPAADAAPSDAVPAYRGTDGHGTHEDRIDGRARDPRPDDSDLDLDYRYDDPGFDDGYSDAEYPGHGHDDPRDLLGGTGEHADSGADPENRHEVDDPDVESPPQVRYRPGRGGFDPEAAAATAHAKYAFRQRVVLALLVLVLAGVGAALLVAAVFWWVAGGLVVALAGYLTYLRRQVRIEEAIRARRAARLAGGRRETDDRRRADRAVGTDGAHDTGAHDTGAHDTGAHDTETPDTAEDAPSAADGGDGETDWTVDDGEPTRVRGTGEPLGVLPARRRTVDSPSCTEHESSLPRLVATPPPSVPEGTSLVDVDAEEDVDTVDLPDTHRRAAGE